MKTHIQSLLPTTSERGAAALIAIVLFIATSTTVVFGVGGPIIRQVGIEANTRRSGTSYYLAEALLEDVVYRTKNGMNVSDDEELTIDGYTATSAIVDTQNGKEMVVTGDVNSIIRKARAELVIDEGVAFNYGVQVGNGGFDISGGGRVIGNVYANGPIIGSNGPTIEGDAISATTAPPTPQYSNSSPIPYTDEIFFAQYSSNEDFAQSFVASDSDTLSKIDIYLRKIAHPGGLTIRITTDNNGKPNSSALASASVSTNSVGGTYGWIEVPFSSPPQLTAGQKYWVVYDGAVNCSNPNNCRYYGTAVNTAVTTARAMVGQYGGVWVDDAPAVAQYINESPGTPSDQVTFPVYNSHYDAAQSFSVDADATLQQIDFYIKRNGWTSNLNVRVTTDNGNSPSSTVLASTTFGPGDISDGAYAWETWSGFVNVNLTAGQKYWVVFDNNGTNCSQWYCPAYILGANSAISDHQVKVGTHSSSWNNTTPSSKDAYMRVYTAGTVSDATGKDAYIGIYTGGIPSEIMGLQDNYFSLNVTGDAWADTIRNTQIGGDIWCDLATNINGSCDTSHGSPPEAPWPVSDSNINSWKAAAEAGGVHSGDMTIDWQNGTVGPLKIDGDLTIGGGGELVLEGTVWVTGDIFVAGGGDVRLSPSYGNGGGVLLADGTVEISGGAGFAGSGQQGSYPLVITTSECPAGSGCGGNNAIELSGGAGAVVLVAQNGTVAVDGGTNVKSVTGYRIELSGGGDIEYESGLADANFEAGPSGGFNIVSWGEVE